VCHHEQGFRTQRASAALAVLCVLSVMTLVMPNFLVIFAAYLFLTVVP
jgi:Ca2+:H+ antiporter